MNPAPSVIIFSTLSGAGFGLLFFLGLGLPTVTGFIAFGFYLIAYLLAVGGLLASVFHLKNKKNAWKSYSQWRTSWLSREGWFAVSALLLMAIYAGLQVFLDTTVATIGFLGAALSLCTVFSTGMIYAQLKTIPRWNQPATPAFFVTASLAGGALLSNNPTLANILLILLGIVVGFHWWKGDSRFAEAGSTIGTATQLSGKVSLWEKPHTGENYLTHEMVYQVARKHAVKLRIIAIVLMTVVPVLLVLIFGAHHLPVLLAVVSHLIGLFAQRWLFFAEAEHVVGLYYGAHTAKQAT
ncbi:dimethyl sulfoxide reductase anchor subunit family protein [Jannaschia donghaensis]|uniref:Formate-dependent nitrite reductase, membrane component n=1 Tax=Jannaschia donghaensis TaxID=420998 RepID=A0A0M6YJE7_9RHOB|nr:DmsC/YnfH family molybdoenzyme membrane anchor subunit [Jannaschia donghaensis]CTQ50481.1 Formate-dependent nitrite reductase, membrane component [Jannaschia donghaensis]